MTVNDLSQPPHFQAAVRAMLEGLRAELGDAAKLVAMDPGDGCTQEPGWKMTPARRSAAWFEVRVHDYADVQVVVEPGLIIEFWQPRTPSEALAHLEAVCRSIVGGRLRVLRKLTSGALKYRLELGDGEAIEGSMSWRWPAMPWTQLETIDFRPYVGAG